MRDKQVNRFLQEQNRFACGVISSGKPSLSSTLSSVLETGEISPKYFLSSKACAGILRRAERRGKALPPALHQALTAAAEAGTQEDDAKTT